MNIQARVVHQLDGRVRLHLPQCRGDKNYFERLAQQLSGVGAVHSVRTNALTGSIVLEFSGTLEDAMRGLDGLGGLELQRMPQKATPRAQAAPVAAPPLFRLVSGRDINPMLMAGAAFSIVGLVQTARGQVMLPALSAFWYAVNAFRQARSPPMADAADTGRVLR